MKKWRISVHTKQMISTKLVACIGYFDGIHLGHKALIDKTVEIAKEKGFESALITFDPDPWVTIKGLKDIKHLNTMEERSRIAQKYGIENWIVLDFTKEMSLLSPSQFIDCLSNCNLDTLVCGFDFHYGAKGKGDTLSLIEDSKGKFNVVVIDSVDNNGEKISTTRITKLIVQGNVEEAAKLLNYPYRLSGEVIGGRHVGRKIGFPTANIQIDLEYIIPSNGVYAGYTWVDNIKYQSMINIGHNPTFNYTNKVSIESHILDFHGDLYGKQVCIEFVKMIRDEKKFENVDALIAQLDQDVKTVKEVLL